MTPELRPYCLVCDAIALLFQPYAEVVLHDLATETVVHIAGNFSKREIGEASLLSEIGFSQGEAIIGPYEKVNWDGRSIKAISAVLRNADGKAIGVLCINADVSDFHAALRTLNALVRVPVDADKPESLFKEDWHERVNEYVQQWTVARGLTVSSLSRNDKQALVIALSADGAFGGKNAASYISRILGMGRATVYKYLSQGERAMIVIDRERLAELPLLTLAAPAIRDAYIAVTDGRANLPPVGYLPLPGRNADCHIKYGYIEGDPIFVVKIASGFYDNPAKGLPSSTGMMVAVSAETGDVVAVLDDKGLLTDLRTGLGGAIATTALWRKDACSIGIVGAGTQARIQIRALASLSNRPLRFTVWGRSMERANAVLADLADLGLHIAATTDLEALCRQSDAIVTTTPSKEPLIRSEWIRPGTHITAMGADAPGKQELETALVARADRLFVDLAEQCLDHGEFSAAARAVVIQEERCVALGAVLSGAAEGRHSDNDITIADLTGIATQDIAIARTVLDELGLLGRSQGTTA